MKRAAAVTLAAALQACASTPRRTAPHSTLQPPTSTVEVLPPPPAPPPPAPEPPLPDAVAAVGAAVGALPEVHGEAHAWLPSRLLGVLAERSGALPVPSAPTEAGGVTRWVLLGVTGTAVSSLSGACPAVTEALPQVACALDAVELRGARRPRLVLAWRGAGVRPSATVALPLRALARVGPGVCLVSAQRALRTLDLVLRADSTAALGRALAMLTAVPGLSSVLVARTEPRGGGLEAVLSWTLDRADRDRAELEEDPWPARCDGASVVGQEAAAGALPVVVGRVDGAQARGAVVSLAHREWLVTLGDRVGTWTVAGLSAAEVTVRASPRGVPEGRPVRLRSARRP
ncbi:MAG: hypothetical protein HY909_18825 [Deltaproteobacteria bacterium]|nr:hypothetical protein [Deltaproteobacteria bacterium]